jgi:hypothetical protein
MISPIPFRLQLLGALAHGHPIGGFKTVRV